MNPAIADLLRRRAPLPHGTRCLNTLAGKLTGGDHDLTERQITAGNRLWAGECFWLRHWKDLHENLRPIF